MAGRLHSQSVAAPECTADPRTSLSSSNQWASMCVHDALVTHSCQCVAEPILQEARAGTPDQSTITHSLMSFQLQDC